MAGGSPTGGLKGAVQAFRESEHWAVALAREILWVVAVVGGIALLLFLLSGTWPAVVAVESESMLPNMQVNDLVFIVAKDRFGELQSFETGQTAGYMKFGNYGDVIIYRPNGASDIHPIIHRAMAYRNETWFDANLPGGASHGGFLTRGDHNQLYDQQSSIQGIGPIEPVKEEWIVGKALFSVPFLGYPTLHYLEFATVVLLLLAIHWIYTSWREGGEEKGRGEMPKEKKKGKR